VPHYLRLDQISAQIRISGEARQFGKGRSRFLARSSMSLAGCCWCTAKKPVKMGDYSQSQIIWRDQSQLMWCLTLGTKSQSKTPMSVSAWRLFKNVAT
jgi:hypothetical protein